MFGLPSFTKLLVLAAVLAAVWYGFKFVGRLDKQRKEEARLQKKAPAAQQPAKADTGSEDMVQCAVCGTYVAASGAANCGRPDCPY